MQPLPKPDRLVEVAAWSEDAEPKCADDEPIGDGPIGADLHHAVEFLLQALDDPLLEPRNV